MTIAGQSGEIELQFEHCVLATGSHPTRIPSLSIDSPRMLDSTSALDLPDVPKSLLVIGGGYIGLELGTVYATLGSKVSVVEMTPGLLPGADRDLVNVLHKRLEKLFAAIMLNTKVVEGGGRRERASASRSKATSTAEGADLRPCARRRWTAAELEDPRPRFHCA